MVKVKKFMIEDRFDELDDLVILEDLVTMCCLEEAILRLRRIEWRVFVVNRRVVSSLDMKLS